ncbi:hypothetical protein AB1Y20_005200 [Prymnesium parvum]|uniref:Uncharacterized protein n=1 Tax=Prymnesium parvum TaxID=97485 RepID=A0AB34J5V1_PRYPA
MACERTSSSATSMGMPPASRTARSALEGTLESLHTTSSSEGTKADNALPSSAVEEARGSSAPDSNESSWCAACGASQRACAFGGEGECREVGARSAATPGERGAGASRWSWERSAVTTGGARRQGAQRASQRCAWRLAVEGRGLAAI